MQSSSYHSTLLERHRMARRAELKDLKKKLRQMEKDLLAEYEKMNTVASTLAKVQEAFKKRMETLQVSYIKVKMTPEVIGEDAGLRRLLQEKHVEFMELVKKTDDTRESVMAELREVEIRTEVLKENMQLVVNALKHVHKLKQKRRSLWNECNQQLHDEFETNHNNIFNHK